MIWLFFVIGLGKATEEHVNKLRGPWEVIPITGSLEENTEFLPIYIDDVMDEFDSTMDMLILQSGKNIEWISDIRGTSITTKSTVISNSLWTLVKVSYFDDDPFPDLLICTSVIQK